MLTTCNMASKTRQKRDLSAESVTNAESWQSKKLKKVRNFIRKGLGMESVEESEVRYTVYTKITMFMAL